MLLQIDQECLDVYKRKVDQATKSRSHLLQTLADAKLELSTLLASLGEKTCVGIPDKSSGTIKEQLAAIAPALEQLWKQKDERIKEFSDVQTQIQKICGEIAGSSERAGNHGVDEFDLSLKKLDEFHEQLQELQKEKDYLKMKKKGAKLSFLLEMYFGRLRKHQIVVTTKRSVSLAVTMCKKKNP